jgi:hypothetical protein
VKEKPKNRIYENLNESKMFKHGKEFTGGALMGGITGGGWIFSQPDLLNTFFIAFILKLAATGVLAAVSGFATILMTDYYKHHIQQKLFKNKKDAGNKRIDKDEAA